MGLGPKLFRFLLIVCFCPVAFPQSSAKGTVELNGQVTNAASGEPVARALVEVGFFVGVRMDSADGLKSPAPPPAPVFSDATGAFHFWGLPAGNFNISVSKPQFQSAFENTESEPGAKTVQIRLTHLGAVTGTVTDAEGRPIMGVNVILYQTPVVDGQRSLTESRNITTDDRGQYRLWNITPGKYVLKAAGRGRGTALYSTETLPTFSAAESFAPVFFGGASDWRTASPIDIGSVSETTADFRLFLQPVRRIRGTVAGTTLFRNATFQLFDQRDNLVSSRAALSAGGGFELLDILPGSYTLRVSQGTGSEQVFGEVEVTVKDANLEGVSIPLRPGVNVTVNSDCKLSMDATQVPCGFLTLYGPQGTAMPIGQTRGSASSNTAPGQYHFVAHSLNSYVSSILVGGQVVRPGETLRVSEGMGPIEVQALQDGGTIEPKLEIADVRNAENVQFLAVPTSESYTGPLQFPPGASDFMKFAPGDYSIYALRNSDLQELEYRNPEALRALTPGATVRVEPNGHHTFTIRSLSK
jgi:Carboxypeptidase regulatory-like domain